MNDRTSSDFSKQEMGGIGLWAGIVVVGVTLLIGSAPFAQDRKGVADYTIDKQRAYPDMAIGDLYAVVVGVSRYANPKIRQLNYSDKDARDFAQFLRSQEKLFRKTYVTVLLNEQATSARVKKELVYELKKAGKDDTVVLFLSGHGADDPQNPGEYFFITHDGQPDNLEATAVNLTEMKFMKRLDTRRAVLIADTCHAGGFSMHGVKAVEASFRRLMNQFKESEGKVILTSCQPHEISRESESLGNSVFTYYLLEGLKGAADANGDGIVALQEVYQYVYEKAKHETGGDQHPQLDGRIAGLFPLSLTSRPGFATGARPSSSTRPQGEPPQRNEVAELMHSAQKGDTDAQFFLGMAYRQGRLGFPRNQSEALKWLKKAAQGGHTEARVMLASMRGSGATSSASASASTAPAASPVPSALQSASSYVQNLWRRAHQGESRAQYVLAYKLEQGDGVQRNLDEAKRWYKAAADQGDSDGVRALRRLGVRVSYPQQRLITIPNSSISVGLGDGGFNGVDSSD